MITNLENNNLEELIKDGKFLVDFYAQWCGPCKMMHPVLENISDKINIIKVDIDKFQEIANKYKVMSVPTLIFFKSGEKVLEKVGYTSEEELLEIIEKL